MFIGKINPLPFWERFKAFIKSYPGMAGILGIACFVWTLLYKMLFVNIEASYQWLVPLGDVFYAVALSVIASVIFYYFTSFIPNYRSKKTIDKLLLKWLQKLDWYGKQMVGDISQLNYAEASKLSQEELRSYCNKKLSAKPQLGSLYFLGPYFGNWFEYFDYCFQMEDTYIEKCLQYQDKLPVQILEILRIWRYMIIYDKH